MRRSNYQTAIRAKELKRREKEYQKVRAAQLGRVGRYTNAAQAVLILAAGALIGLCLIDAIFRK